MKEIYAIFDMDYIPPELREDRGEIEAAKSIVYPNWYQHLISREYFIYIVYIAMV